MTFIMTEVGNCGVIMASDSSQTRVNRKTGHVIGHRYGIKTFYYEQLNMGISSWGNAEVGKEACKIGDWLKNIVTEFVKDRNASGNGNLAKFTEYLVKKLDLAFELDDNKQNITLEMGLHIGGFDSIKNEEPDLFHIYINHGQNRFILEHSSKKFYKKNEPVILVNGFHKEFSQMWPLLNTIDKEYTNLFISKYCNGKVSLSDPIAVRAEWIGSWVRQIGMVMKRAGLPEYVGKDTRILTFDHKSNIRCFILRQYDEVSLTEFEKEPCCNSIG